MYCKNRFVLNFNYISIDIEKFQYHSEKGLYLQIVIQIIVYRGQCSISFITLFKYALFLKSTQKYYYLEVFYSGRYCCFLFLPVNWRIYETGNKISLIGQPAHSKHNYHGYHHLYHLINSFSTSFHVIPRQSLKKSTFHV